ncbi:peptidase S8/S53 domain-containing protein [Mycena crocata]|nr:peptidase S8/S53 domain-containing protein [Mycena crocata]
MKDAQRLTANQIYILDSGINIGHEEFSGRAESGGIAPRHVLGPTGNPPTSMDHTGHGVIAVASVAVGSKLGVANQAKIIAIKVSDTNKSWTSAVYWGISAAVAHYKKIPPSEGIIGGVINISIHTVYDDDQEGPFTEAFRAAIPVVTAAGNNHEDAVNTARPI